MIYRQAKDLAGYALVTTKSANKLHAVEGPIGGELGLKLESRKSTVDVLIVDYEEKSPTEN